MIDKAFEGINRQLYGTYFPIAKHYATFSTTSGDSASSLAMSPTTVNILKTSNQHCCNPNLFVFPTSFLMVHDKMTRAIYASFSFRGSQWSAANRLHGQRTGAFSWRPVLGLSRKTDQFRFDPTQNCAHGWWSDRVKSVYSPHTLEMLRHLPTCDQPPGFVPHAYQAPTPSLPPSNPP